MGTTMTITLPYPTTGLCTTLSIKGVKGPCNIYTLQANDLIGVGHTTTLLLKSVKE